MSRHKQRYRHRLGFFFVCVWLSAGVALGADSSAVFPQLLFPPGEPPVPLTSVTLTADAHGAGQPALIEVSYLTPELEFPYDYLVGVTLPSEFSLGQSVSAEFTDDSPAPDPDLRSITFIDHTVVFRFRRTYFAPKVGQRGIISISGVNLPERADDYLASAFISDTAFVVLAGPGFSSALTVTPGPVAQVSLTPSEPQSLRAGETLGFAAIARDEYGNGVTNSPVEFDWRFARSGDDLGALSPGALLAQSVGAGAVIARYGDFADTSGQITVMPGALADIRLELPDILFVGGALCQPGYAVFYDGFGNVKSDLDPAVDELSLSASSGRVTPERIALGPGFAGVVDLAAAGLRVDDVLKRTELRARFRGIESEPTAVSLGGIQTLPLTKSSVTTLVPSQTLLTVELRFSPSGRFDARLDSLRFGSVDVGFTVSEGVDISLPFVAEAARRFMLGSADSVWLVETFGAFAVNDEGEPAAWCETRYLDLKPIQTNDIGPVASARVDTLVSGMSGVRYGFGFTSSTAVSEIRRGILQLETEPGVWTTVAKLALAQAPTTYQAAIVDSLPFEFIGADLESLVGTSADSRLILDVAGGYFAYTDTVFGEEQVFVRAAVEPSLEPGSFGPTVVAPLSAITFGAVVSFAGIPEATIDVQSAELLLQRDGLMVTLPALAVTPDSREFEFTHVFGASSANTEWSARLRLEYLDAVAAQSVEIGLPQVTVGPLQQLRIQSLIGQTPNFPTVNTGQAVPLSYTIRNLTGLEIAGVQFELTSSGQGLDTVVEIGAVAGNSSFIGSLTIPAQMTPGVSGPFAVRVTSESGARAEDDTTFTLTVERPAQIAVALGLAPSAARDGLILVTAGSPLTVSAEVANSGDAQISGGRLSLSARGAGISLDTSFALGASPSEVSLGPTLTTGSLVFTAQLIEAPVDANSGEAAALEAPGADRRELRVEVVDHVAALQATVSQPEDFGLLRDTWLELAEIELDNASVVDVSSLRLLTVEVRLTDLAGAPLAPNAVFVADQLEALDESGRIAAGVTTRESGITLNFAPNEIPVGESVRYRLRARVRSQTAVNAFTLDLPVSLIRARALDGLQAGETIVATAPPGAPPREQRSYVLSSATFADSFQPRHNPFNPDLGANEYAYTLDSDADIEFAIYTLTGDEVYRRDFAAGAPGGAAGVQRILWDGRNSDGVVVRDGVYVLVLTNRSTGERITLKQAALR